MRDYVGHFDDESVGWTGGKSRTLCGLESVGIVWRSDLRADCKKCCDEWHKRGWPFPLPEIATTD